jgi:threonine/homoserine/homoserine lactone efflux protein
LVSWSSYFSFLAFAVVLVLVPGPDFAVVTKNTLAGGRRRGTWTSIGVTSSNLVQGAAAAAGLGALIVRAQPVFEAIRWAGLCYLLVLAIQSFRAALSGDYAQPSAGGTGNGSRVAVAGWRQGFLSNITNPKVLVFYLAVLPQFLGSHPTLIALFALALTHAVLSLVYLVLLVSGMHRAREIFARRRVRRSLDAATGAALLGFGVKLALD